MYQEQTDRIIKGLPVIQKAHIWEPKIEDVAKAFYEAGKAECAKTHFKPDWGIKARDIKSASEEGYKAGKAEGIKAVVEWIEKTFSRKLTLNEIMATNTWQLKTKEWGMKGNYEI